MAFVAILRVPFLVAVAGCSIRGLPPAVDTAASEAEPDLGTNADRVDANGGGDADTVVGRGGTGGGDAGLGGAGGSDVPSGSGGLGGPDLGPGGVGGRDARLGSGGMDRTDLAAGDTGSSDAPLGGGGAGGMDLGGTVSTGGLTSTGGVASTGGLPGTGGVTGTGGLPGTGGVTSLGDGGGGDGKADAAPCTVTDVVELVSGYKTWTASTLNGFCIQVTGANEKTQVNCVSMDGRAITVNNGPAVSTCVGKTSCGNFYMTLGTPWSDGAWYVSATAGSYQYPVLAFFPGY